MMLNKRSGIVAFSLPVALLILIQALVAFPTRVAAQCPTMDPEGATFGSTNFNTVKSQMWYNDGIWWGVFSDDFTGIHFYSFPNNAATQGPIIDASITGIPDALWDGTNLFVMVWKSVASATLYKYTYNSATKTYALIAGFPVQIPLNNSSTAALVMEKDNTGKLWATYTGTQGGLSDGKVRVIWSTSADHTTWNTTGAELESGLTPNTIEISAITHFGNKIGIAWSNQPAKQIGFRYHVDGDPETTWSTKEIVDSGLGPRGLGGVADDHLAMKATPDGRIFLVAKDNDNDGTPLHATEGRIWLYIRTTAGVWGQKTIIQPDFSQLPTRPVLMLDTTNNEAYVIYHDESPSGSGRNFIAHSSMDSPFFDFPCVFQLTAASNPTSSKQNVTASTGFMAIGSTGNTGSGELIFRKVNLPSNNPFPSITSINPSSSLVGGAAFTLTVNGSNFINSSSVQWNGSDRVTTYVSPTQLTASIIASDIQTAGIANVTVTNPAPGGGVSTAVNYTINNPAPTLSSISPTTKTAGDVNFTLTVNGSNFLNTSITRFNGVDRPTTFVNSTQLTAQITAADVQAAGTFPVTVFNASPGGGLSSAVNLTVNNPVPTLSSISPTTKNRGDAGFTLTVTGTNFVNGSIVRFNGSNRTTTYFSSTQLTAQITAADLQAAGAFPITVFNATPGGGTSNSINLNVNNPVPTLSSISPNSKTAGDAAFTLTVNGTGYINGSVVRFNGSDRSTTFVSSTQLTAQILAADVASAGSFPITVFNPAPGGGSSSAINLTVGAGQVNNPIATLSSLSPTSKTAGDAAFTLTVNGSNLISSSVVRWNGSDRTTTFVNSNQVTAQIAAADVASAGSAAVTVFNPTPGGGTSNSLSFTINPVGPVGYEADVAPRPNGSNNGSVAISDWVQTGRFSAGVDTPAVGSEFQRADCAPKSTFGGGTITVSDWVQAGRYAAGLDPVVAAGGPTAPLSGAQKVGDSVAKNSDAETNRKIRIVAGPLNAGQAASVKIEMDSQGNENALGLSVTFDPTKLTYISPAILGSDAAGVVLNVNTSQVASGRLGIAMAQPAGSAFAAGTRHLVTLNFNVAVNASGSTTIGFGDQPIPREISDPDVNILEAAYDSVTLDITPASNPVPVISSLSSTFADIGSAGFTLIVNGSNFVSGCVVRWNGNDRSTSFVSSTQLSAQITAADLLTAATATITVSNPPPAGGISNIVNFEVRNPSPSLSGISPTSAISGGDAFTLTVNGSNFVDGSVVAWNGESRITSFDSSTQLTAQIPATDILAAGTAVVTVINAGPGGGTSSAINFSINNPVPSISGLAPDNAIVDSGAFTLTVNGSGFRPGSIIRWNGDARSTTFVSSTQLTAQVNAADISAVGTAAVTVFNPTPGGGLSGSLSFAINPEPPQLQFSAANFSSSEGGGSAVVTVTRSGDTSGEATVDFGVADPIVYVPCTLANGGVAAQNCDYTLIAATVRFAAGETTKNVTIPMIDDAYVEGAEIINIKLTNAIGASLSSQNTATLTINDNDSVLSGENPIDDAQLFVRQQYLDFLSREPDQGGWDFWTEQITSCPPGDAQCIHDRRVRVADAFFFEPEFQESGAYVYRIYRAGLGLMPTYAQFQPDRALVLGGVNLDQSKTDFAVNFVRRDAFLQTHAANQTAEQFVDQILAGVLQTSGVDLSGMRQSLVGLYDNSDAGRGNILRQIADNQDFIDAEYNRSFVLNEYFGYLRRDPDQDGFNFWLDQVSRYPLRDTDVQHAMVCSFITSAEYQLRFSTVMTSSNNQCPQ